MSQKPSNSKQPSRRRSAAPPTFLTEAMAWQLGSFLFGFILGLIFSLYYGWVLAPRPLPTTPADLTPAGQAAYTRLIAAAFAYDQDAAKAQTRLAALRQSDLNAWLIRLTEQQIRQGGDVRDITALVELTQTVGQLSPLMMAYRVTPTPTNSPTPTSTATATPTETTTPTPSATATNTTIPIPTIPPVIPTLTLTETLQQRLQELFIFTPTTALTPTNRVAGSIAIRPLIRRPTPTPTHSPTPTATPTQTPTPDPAAPFRVVQSRFVCDEQAARLLKVIVRDQTGAGLSGVEVVVRWDSGQDRFFTGLKPDIEPGYADFQMTAGISYQVELPNRVIQPSLPTVTLAETVSCRDAIPSWQLIFQQGID